MKRLFSLVLAGTLFVATMAFALPTSQKHNWEITFSKFAYVWINIGGLTFNLDSASTPSGVGYLQNLTGVYEPSQSGLMECLTGVSSFSEPSGSYTGTQTGPSAPTCRFAPSIASGGAGYSAQYQDADSDGENNVADADLFILSTGDGWTLTAQVTSGTVPGGVTLEVYPYVWDPSESEIEKKDGNAAALGTDAVSIEDTDPSTVSAGAGDKGYYVVGGFWQYLQPLNFALAIDLGSVSLPISSTLEVTYTVTAP